MGEALMQMYDTLPATAKKELFDFALFLLTRDGSKVAPLQKESMYGVWKDDSFYMAPDFDEPVDDFAEYM